MNTLHLTAENPDELIAGFGAGARIKLQTSATEAGAFSDVTTIPLVAGTRSYTYEHLAGISSTWYKVRFEDSTGANANDYGAAFQVGDETAGLLCSLYDVKQRIGNPNSTADDELLMEIIREVSDEIESYVGQWLAPRPTNPSSTTTLTFDVEGSYPYPTRSVLLERGGRIVGIRSVTAIGYATTGQPDTGGTYSSLTVADVVIRPVPTASDPGLRLEFLPTITGSTGAFYPGWNALSVTGSFGPAAVPPRIQSVALAMVTRRYMGKETAAAAVSVGPDGGVKLLSDIPPGMRETLDRMRIPNVA